MRNTQEKGAEQMKKENTKLGKKLERKLKELRTRKEAANTIMDQYHSLPNGPERYRLWELERDILFNDKNWRKVIDENGENWGVATIPINWK